jgi:hypothetical protein
LLREWAAANDVRKLEPALDRFAATNRNSIMWTVFLEVAAEHPLTLGRVFMDVLDEPTFLIHPDYSYGATALLGALHKTGDTAVREKLENLLLNLTQNVQKFENEIAEELSPRITHAQNRLLRVLDESKIVLDAVRTLRAEREKIEPLPENKRPEGPRVFSWSASDPEMLTQRGIDLKDPANQELLRLRDALKPLLKHDDNKVNVEEIELHWHVVEECERILQQDQAKNKKMADELWGHLVGACENVVGFVTTWPKDDHRWQVIRRILLKAAEDPNPGPDSDSDKQEDGWPSWGWPSPRIDAARGLPFLVNRLGCADGNVVAALRKFILDGTHALRFNFAERVTALGIPETELMWELIDAFIANEKQFFVLDGLLYALNRLGPNDAAQMMPRLRLIAERASQCPASNHIHETLAHTYFFHYLRTGDSEAEAFVKTLIAQCDTERGYKAVVSLLQTPREWLVIGDIETLDLKAEKARTRTWGFYLNLLNTAQEKLEQFRESETPKQEELDRAAQLIDGIASALYFASGAFEKTDKKDEQLTPAQLQRFWSEALPIYKLLVNEPHPHIAYQVLQTLTYLLPCDPPAVFLLASKCVFGSSEKALFQHEPLAVDEVVKLVERALADHREIFVNANTQQSECLEALLKMLDLFVEAGWPQARQLTLRLEEIYR